MTSTYDSAESIATSPPKSDLDDEQISDMLVSPLYLREREASADQPRVCHSYRENSVSSSSRYKASAGKPAALFSYKRKSSQESHSDRDGTSLAHRTAQGENETKSRLSESESDARIILEEQRNNGKQEDSVRKEIVVVSDTMRTSVQNGHQRPLLPLNHRQKRKVEIL